ncbi:hypothetical protein C8R44DRAFT_866339 [Mycena epipterygia]|nr:hypothetical protein C8R44DRAFT_866339 [Mycena epipterygia]
MFPKSIDDIELRLPTSPAGRMLLELVPPLDKSQFTFKRCNLGHIHYFQLEEGEGDPQRIGSFVMRCPGPLIRTGPARVRCPPNYGKTRPPDQVRKLLWLRDSYKHQYDAANILTVHLKGVGDVLQAYWSLGNCPPLPQNAGIRLSNKLEAARNVVDNLHLDAELISSDPEILEDIGRLARPSGPVAEFKVDDSASDCDWDAEYIDETPDLDPSDDTLPLVLPSPPNGSNSRQMRIITYSKPDERPRIVICWVQDEKSFILDSYPSPLSEGTYLFYCVIHERYLSAEDPINLIGRGNFLILVQTDVLHSHCPRIQIWEERVRDIAEMDNEPSSLPPSSPLATSSQPVTRVKAVASSSNSTAVASSSSSSSQPVTRVNAVASSSKSTAVASSSNINKLATSSKNVSSLKGKGVAKRPASPVESTTRKKSKRTEVAPGKLGTVENPFVVPSSDNE